MNETDANTTLLLGVVGSRAYGLDHNESDIDRLGVFVAPTVDVAGLHWNVRDESIVTTKPDVTMHEVGKFLRLALRCNPTTIELLWLTGEHIEVMEPFFGARLYGLREALLSEPAVRNAYGEYARQQIQKLQRGRTTNKIAKHARHTMRLLRQGRELLETGRLTVKVSDPEEYLRFGALPVDTMLRTFAAERKAFAQAKSVLPEKPDVDAVDAYVCSVRARFLWGS